MSKPNPYVELFLKGRPLTSYVVAQFGEEVWDAAITAVLRLQDKKGRISVSSVEAIKSTYQRRLGGNPFGVKESSISHEMMEQGRNLYQRAVNELDERQISQIAYELHYERPIAAIKFARQYLRSGLAETKFMIVDFLPTLKDKHIFKL